MTIVPRRPRALVLDDQYLIASAIEAFLSDSGYETVMALSEQEALDAIASRQFDVAIVDYHLGSGTSDGVIARLQAAGTPFAICTGSIADDLSERHPGVAVICKPFAEGDIALAVERLVGATWPRGL